MPPETFGARILITSLFNTIQPLIRHEISDMVSLATAPCARGRPFPLIAEIQGRREEALLLSDPSGQPLPVHPNAIHQALELAPVGDWQLVQSRSGLKLLLEREPAPKLEAQLRSALADALATAGAGKAPLIRREI